MGSVCCGRSSRFLHTNSADIWKISNSLSLGLHHHGALSTQVKATVTFFRREPDPWYRSCTLGDCKRKVRAVLLLLTVTEPSQEQHVDDVMLVQVMMVRCDGDDDDHTPP